MSPVWNASRAKPVSVRPEKVNRSPVGMFQAVAAGTDEPEKQGAGRPIRHKTNVQISSEKKPGTRSASTS